MLNRFIHQLQFVPGSTYSLFSSPPSGPEASYQIHLVASTDPAYIPEDFEAWPIYYHTIVDTLRQFPEAHDATVEAVRQKRQELKGLENRKIPPGTRPRF